MDNLTASEMINSSHAKSINTKDLNNGMTCYLDTYKDRVYIVSVDEKVELCTEDREKAFSFFESI